MSVILKRSSIHYLLALFILTFYGVQVCPFLDSLTVTELIMPIVLVFLLLWIIRLQLEKSICQQDYKHQVSQQFKTDLGLFLGGAVILGSYNSLIYSFPAESAGKVLVGMAVLGYFSACELSLFREYQIAQTLLRNGQHLTPDATPFPLTRKFNLFAIICAFSVVGVVFLVINKDLEWLIHTGSEIPLETSQGYILGEISFVVATIMAYVLTIILGYSRNLKLFITNEHKTLEQVTRGELQARVPVTSNDEFGLMAQHTNAMIEALSERTRELNITRDASILGLASLAETRDNETGGHILRTQHYVRVLAQQLALLPESQPQLTEDVIELLYKSAPLHDVGKVGIPDSILLKPGKLTDEEFEIMKGHPQIGADALQVAEDQLGSNSFLQYAREISLTHHEKWDGSGYPNRLKGRDIPVSGRLMALADVYDALISKRVYKPAFSHEKARDIILEGRGIHFDPDVVDAFIAVEQQFVSIARQYADQQAEAA